jgi:hypothetical protein
MKKVLVGSGKRNFPEDLADMLRDLADVVYRSPGDEEYFIDLGGADAIIAGMEKVDEDLS